MLYYTAIFALFVFATLQSRPGASDWLPKR